MSVVAGRFLVPKIKMRYVVEVTSKNSGRLGCLIQNETGRRFPTPLLMQSTKSGSLPYLSKEVFKYVTDKAHVLQISLSTTEHMEEALKVFQKGIAPFVGYKDFPIYLSVKDPCEIAPTGFNDKDIVPVFTRRGKLSLTAERYMNFVETFQPDLYHSLCDSDTNIESSKKRIQKSVDRTEQFFKVCLEHHRNSEKLSKALFFAPIVGGYSKEARLLSIKTVSSHPVVGGFLIDGLHNYGETASKLNVETLKDIVAYILKELNSEKPKMMLGAYTPLAILEMIRLGVDIFDTSYVYIVTSSFKALTFKFRSDDKTDIGRYIDLKNERFKDDFNPLLCGCSCLACTKHSRAYVYHLVNTKELLGPILLMIHNTHHYLKFFEVIRESVANDKLSELIDLIGNQPDKESDENKLSIISEKIPGDDKIQKETICS